MSGTINSVQASSNNPVVANAYFDGTYDPTQGTVYRTDDVLSNLLDDYTGEEVQFKKVEDPTGITADGVIYRQKDGEMFKRAFVGSAHVRWFGAKGNGIIDDTLAIQKALQVSRRIFLDAGIYKITDELVIPNYCTIEGVGNSWASSSNDSVIFYDGLANQNKAVLRVSTSVIGIEPLSALTNVQIRNLTVNGNSKAEIGLYTAYATNDSSFYNITAINCVQHGIQIEKGWYASYRNLIGRTNLGCGITIGKNGWGGVNGVYFSHLRVHSNGQDQQFNETTNKEWGYGVGIFSGANLKIRNITSEGNDGCGLLFSSQTEVVGVDGVYLESNCPRGTKDWGIIYVGRSNGRGHFLKNIYCHGAASHPNPQTIWITGGKPAVPLDLDTVEYGRLVADHNGYTLSNVSYLISDYIEGILPQDSKVNGAYSLNTLYVRNGGLDTNDGRTVNTAFQTLQKALKVANTGLLVTTINCEGIDLNAPTLNLNDFNRPLIIDGNGTAVINNTTGGQGLTIDNSKNLLTITGFSKISRLFINNSEQVKLENINISPDDSSSNPAIYINNSNVIIKGSSINGVSSTATTRSGIRLINSRLKIVTTAVENFSTTRFFRIVEGSNIVSDTNHPGFGNTFWEDNSGFIVGQTKIFSKGGFINFSNVTHGTTANRPSGVEIGTIYFDTNLLKPIWWAGTNWVDASGALV